MTYHRMHSAARALALLCAASFVACGDDGGLGGVPVTIAFAAQAGAEPFRCGGSYTGLGTSSTTLEASDFRMYVHDVTLVDAGGALVPLSLAQDGIWQNGSVALLDFEDGTASCESGTRETNASIRGFAPEGTYTGVRFKLGVPDDRNHADIGRAAPPLNLTSMFWDWTDGYKFLRIEGSTETEPGFRVHLGSTECSGEGAESTCVNRNVADVALDGMDPTTETVVADLASLLADIDIDANAGGPPGCMSAADDPDCGPIFASLGLRFPTGEATGTQSFFRVPE